MVVRLAIEVVFEFFLLQILLGRGINSNGKAKLLSVIVLSVLVLCSPFPKQKDSIWEKIKEYEA